MYSAHCSLTPQHGILGVVYSISDLPLILRELVRSRYVSGYSKEYCISEELQDKAVMHCLEKNCC